MKISTRILAALMALGVCAFAVGCGQDAKPANTEGAKVIQKVTSSPVAQEFAPLNEVKEGRKNVYAVLKVIKGSYWSEVVKGLKEGAEAANVNLYMGGALREIDWQTQKDLINTLKDKKVDAVILAPSDSTNMVHVVQELKAKKIPVILVDSGLNSKDYDAGFMTNNALAGVKAGEEMINLLKKSGAKETDELTVRIKLSNQNNSTLMDRLDGLNSHWTQKAPKAWKLNKMLIDDHGDSGLSKSLTDKAIKNTNNIRGIVSLNNRATVAAVKSIKESGRKDIALVGFDYAPETAEMIGSADLKATSIVQNQYRMGFDAVRAAADFTSGSKPTGQIVDTGVKIITAENQKEYEASLKK